MAVIGVCIITALCCGGCNLNSSFRNGSSGTGASTGTTDSGTGDTESGKFVLSVSHSSWSGWTGTVSEVESQSYEVKQGEHYIVSEGGLGLAFTIVQVGNDRITIETDESMAPVNENGTINLGGHRNKFEIVIGKPCELATPTMDAGTNYTLSLNRE